MVNERAQVLMKGGHRSKNIYAAGEIMAGNVLGRGYAAGIGVTIGLSLAALPVARQPNKHWTDPHRNRRKKRHPSMLTAELLEEGKHLMTVCNACRYCEGYCAVWKSMETRTVFEERDLNYLSNSAQLQRVLLFMPVFSTASVQHQSTKDSCEIAGVQL